MRRGALVLSAAAVSTLVLSGCQVASPTTTLLRYAPADGIELDGASLDVRDLVVVSHGNGAPAVVSGSLINSGSEPIEVSVSVAGQPVEPIHTVAPGTAVRLDGVQADGSEGERTILPALETPAGMSVDVRLSTGQETLSGAAPVLLPHGVFEIFADDAGGPVAPHPTSEASDH